MLGKAAVTIWCDVAPEVRDEFNDWHAHEHMPERLSIPGFRRGSRWVSAEGGSYFILYELESEATLTSSAYLERLNNPTPWSRKMMPHHRNMVRGLCVVESNSSPALGQALLTARFSGERTLDFARKGIVAAHVLRNIAHPPPQTAEQKLRGGDAAPDRVALVTGYDAGAVAAAAPAGAVTGLYTLAYVIS